MSDRLGNCLINVNTFTVWHRRDLKLNIIVRLSWEFVSCIWINIVDSNSKSTEKSLWVQVSTYSRLIPVCRFMTGIVRRVMFWRGGWAGLRDYYCMTVTSRKMKCIWWQHDRNKSELIPKRPHALPRPPQVKEPINTYITKAMAHGSFQRWIAISTQHLPWRSTATVKIEDVPFCLFTLSWSKQSHHKYCSMLQFMAFPVNSQTLMTSLSLSAIDSR